jgi:hypothetical protein
MPGQALSRSASFPAALFLMPPRSSHLNSMTCQMHMKLAPYFASQADLLSGAIARFDPAELQVIADFLQALTPLTPPSPE